MTRGTSARRVYMYVCGASEPGRATRVDIFAVCTVAIFLCRRGKNLRGMLLTRAARQNNASHARTSPRPPRATRNSGASGDARGARERMPGKNSRAKQTEVRAFFGKTAYDPLERKAPVDDVLPPKNVFKDQRVLPRVPAIPFPEPPTHPVTRPSEEEETPEREREPEPGSATPTE